MSILARLLARLRPVARPPVSGPEPECMSLRDWADLPIHHPLCKG